MPAPRVTTDEYFRLPETLLPQELAYGFVREAPAPTPGHQCMVGELFVALKAHLERYGLGRAWLSPIDVVLDAEKDLVVQPDVIVVATERLSIVRDRVRGAPDLVVEVLSPHPRIGTLTEHLEWFAEYGVRECWLIHQMTLEIEVLVFGSGSVTSRRRYTRREPIRSVVLPDFSPTVESLLMSGY
jgi:Uma2 family endonuclease